MLVALAAMPPRRSPSSSGTAILLRRLRPPGASLSPPSTQIDPWPTLDPPQPLPGKTAGEVAEISVGRAAPSLGTALQGYDSFQGFFCEVRTCS
jgi:hypothetical protein